MRIGFIGAGAMAEALIKGIIDSGHLKREAVVCSDVSPERLRYITETYGITGNNDNGAAVESSDVVILCVKPQVMDCVLKDIKSCISPDKTIVSVAAGISTAFVEKRLGSNVPVVRVMPNTPCLIGRGVSAVSLGSSAGETQREIVHGLFSAVGSVLDVPEHLMNAVTAVSGSGPAYVFLILEALIDGGVTIGLPRDTAESLAVATFAGAAEMAVETGIHPAVLKAKVMSPGGTTAAGIYELEDGRVRAVFSKALEAACERADRLGE